MSTTDSSDEDERKWMSVATVSERSIGKHRNQEISGNSQQNLAVPVHTGHCIETQFEWQHKLFKNFEKVIPESFTFATVAEDDIQENGEFKLSWQINYSVNDYQNYTNVRYNHYKMSHIEVMLLGKITDDYVAYVSIYICDYTLDIKFDSESLMTPVKKILDLIIRNDNNESFIHVKIRLLHKNKSFIRIIENYNSYVKSEKSCNVILNAGDEKLSAHREILAAHSPVFASTFENNWIEGSSNTIDIKDVEPSILKHLLDYIYYAKINSNDVQERLKIIVAADKYLMDGLVKACEDFISNKLDAENVSEAFAVADLVISEKLKKDCVKFIVKNKAVVLKTEGYKNLVKTRVDLVTELFSHVMLCCSLILESDDDDDSD